MHSSWRPQGHKLMTFLFLGASPRPSLPGQSIRKIVLLISPWPPYTLGIRTTRLVPSSLVTTTSSQADSSSRPFGRRLPSCLNSDTSADSSLLPRLDFWLRSLVRFYCVWEGFKLLWGRSLQILPTGRRTWRLLSTPLLAFASTVSRVQIFLARLKTLRNVQCVV